jgi:hypothetical protein
MPATFLNPPHRGLNTDWAAHLARRRGLLSSGPESAYIYSDPHVDIRDTEGDTPLMACEHMGMAALKKKVEDI